MKNRLFVALEIPDFVKEKILLIRSTISDDSNLKWEANDKIHLTLRFIGDVSSDIQNDISKELKFLKNFKVVDCSINKFGFFFRDKKPVILWAGLNFDNYLSNIAEELNFRLEKFSITKEERNFNPHLTLLRLKKEPGINFVNNFKNFTFEPILFTSKIITLYKSNLNREGSKYYAIKKYKLKDMEE